MGSIMEKNKSLLQVESFIFGFKRKRQKSIWNRTIGHEGIMEIFSLESVLNCILIRWYLLFISNIWMYVWLSVCLHSCTYCLRRTHTFLHSPFYKRLCTHTLSHSYALAPTHSRTHTFLQSYSKALISYIQTFLYLLKWVKPNHYSSLAPGVIFDSIFYQEAFYFTRGIFI